MKFIYFNKKYFINEMNSLFSLYNIQNDIFAGITIALIAIPLSLAIALASNMPAYTGLVSAIIGGIIAAIFGGSTLAVSGPAAAMSILVARCIHDFGISGLLIITIICGLMQMISGLLNIGKYAKMIPLSVVSACTAAIGCIILVSQLPIALQINKVDASSMLDAIVDVYHNLLYLQPIALMMAIIAILVMKIVPRFYPKIPTPIIAVIIPTALVYFLNLHNVNTIGVIPHHMSSLHIPNFYNIKNWPNLIYSALEVFFFASLQTLLSVSAIDNISGGSEHDYDHELMGQGLSNLVVPLFGGIPTSSVIVRSTINFFTGGKTRKSAIVHSLFILLTIYLFPKLIEIIPISALAGILIVVGASMVNIKEITNYWQNDKIELLVYTVTFAAIIFTDLISGIQTGILIAIIILAIRWLSVTTSLKLWSDGELLRVSLNGSLLFWSFSKLEQINIYLNNHKSIKYVLFDFELLGNLDQTAVNHLFQLMQNIKRLGKVNILHHLSDSQRTQITSHIKYNEDFLHIANNESDIKKLLDKLGYKHHPTDILHYGIDNFLINTSTEEKYIAQSLALGQSPHTLLITCCDSRLNPHKIFSATLGELFIVRNIGNMVPRYQEYTDNSIGAVLEFALNHLNITHIMICGHTDCGAVKAVSLKQNIDTPALKSWLSQIKLPNNENGILTDIKANVITQIDNLHTYPTVDKSLSNNKLTISACIYDIKDMNVLYWDKTEGSFISMKH